MPSSRSRGMTQAERDYAQFRDFDRLEGNRRKWEDLYASALENETIEAEVKKEMAAKGTPLSLTLDSDVNKMEGNETVRTGSQDQHIFQVFLSYIATPVKSGLMLIDQQAALMRIYYEQYVDMLENQQGSSQQLLFPETLELTPSDLTLVTELEQEIKRLGFSFEYFGKNAIVINGIPSLIASESGSAVFKGLIDDYKKNFLELKDRRMENLARSMAMNSGIRSGKKLSTEEMKSIIDRLFGCKNPNYSPNGRRIYFILGVEKIEELFNRKL